MAVTGDGYKLPPFVIMKGEEGKSIEKNLLSLPFIKKGVMYVHCQKEGWCTSQIFNYWLKEVYLPYQNFISEKCLLILDNATAHNSKDSLKTLNECNIKYSFIPPGMTRNVTLLIFRLIEYLNLKSNKNSKKSDYFSLK